ncbi:MAG: hypothetical protein LBK04_06190 [Clostridiales Family XIII bacterium]|nr:hypothetical protein [Clostridiales Family XIII bacterium]
MKKKTAVKRIAALLALAALLLALVFTGCKNNGNTQSDGSIGFIIDEGTFTVPPGYYKNNQYSDEKAFYFYPEGSSKDVYGDNFSVEFLENEALGESNAAFKKYVLKNLEENAKGYEEKVFIFTDTESETAEGYPLLVFEVRSDDDVLNAVQHYILGCKENKAGFILVETSFFDGTDGEKLEEDAMSLVDSFKWREPRA